MLTLFLGLMAWAVFGVPGIPALLLAFGFFYLFKPIRSFTHVLRRKRKTIFAASEVIISTVFLAHCSSRNETEWRSVVF
jgi:hypothetical protein